jgi:putative glutamine amidotransferase
VLTGGPDVDPELFEEQPLPGLGDIDRVRDEAEIELCHDAIARDVPLLAVCRGIQVLAVACGGTVIQDLDHAGIPGLLNHDLRSFDDSAGHGITVTEGTRLFEILGTTRLRVNSAHHQAVGESGELVVSARSTDGVIEAVEHPVASFVIGVEWHPERTAAPHGHALLSAFVEACTG